MKTVGIIGGFGPETTANFFMQIISLWPKEQSQRPEVLLWNAPVILRDEKELLLNNKIAKSFLPMLINGARKLEKSGADFLVMPCNTLHIFIEDIRVAVDIPVLSIVETTAEFLGRSGVKKVGILATGTTLKSRMFDQELRKFNVNLVTPDQIDQDKLGKIVHSLVLNQDKKLAKNELSLILKKFKEVDVENVVLACTDLHLAINKSPGLTIHDTTSILASATVKQIQNN